MISCRQRLTTEDIPVFRDAAKSWLCRATVTTNNQNISKAWSLVERVKKWENKGKYGLAADNIKLALVRLNDINKESLSSDKYREALFGSDISLPSLSDTEANNIQESLEFLLYTYENVAENLGQNRVWTER